MDVADLPEALAALARDLEQWDDDPFTLRSRDAVLLAERFIAERLAEGNARSALATALSTRSRMPFALVRAVLDAAPGNRFPMASERLQFLAQAETMQEISSALDSLRIFGEIYPEVSKPVADLLGLWPQARLPRRG